MHGQVRLPEHGTPLRPVPGGQHSPPQVPSQTAGPLPDISLDYQAQWQKFEEAQSRGGANNDADAYLSVPRNRLLLGRVRGFVLGRLTHGIR